MKGIVNASAREGLDMVIFSAKPGEAQPHAELCKKHGREFIHVEPP